VATVPETPKPPVVVKRQPTPAEIAAVQKRARTLRLSGIAAGAVGVVGLALGATFAALTGNVSNQINHPPMNAVWDPNIEKRGTVDRALAGTFFAVGGVALATGATLFALGTHEKSAHHFAIAPTLSPGLAAVSMSCEY
jgi:hypothetical protein